MRPLVRVAPGRLLPLLLAAACGEAANAPTPTDPPTDDPPGTGTLVIQAATSGAAVDPDGYQVRLDGDAPRALPSNGAVTLSALPAGRRTVRLDGIADNCLLDGANPRSADVVAGQTTRVDLALACSTSVGEVTVSAATTGADLDADGYSVTFNGGSPHPLESNGAIELDSLASGSRTLTLDGVAANCAVSGENPRSVEVPAGGTVQVTLAVACLARPTARDSAVAGIAGTAVQVDLAALTTTQPERAFELGAPSAAGFTASLAGSIATITPAPGAAGAVEVPYTVTDAAGSASGTLRADFAAMAGFTFTLREVFGDTVVTSPASIRIDGVSYPFVNGVASGQVEPGVHTVSLVQNDATYDADRIELPGGDVRVLFSRFAEDTITFTGDLAAVIRRPSRTDAAFDLGHYQATYDDPDYGHQAPANITLTLFLLTDGYERGCDFATDAALADLRELQDRIAAELAGTWDVVEAEGAAPPPQAGDVQILCDGRGATGTGLSRGDLGEFDGGVSYVSGSGNDDRTLNAFGKFYAFGAVREDRDCRVPSLFNDEEYCGGSPGNLADDVTAHDRHEGLVMAWNYGRPAAARRVASGGATPFFTLRP